MSPSERLAKARLNGYSWDEIHGYLGDRKAAAQAWGYHPDEINAYLGYRAPALLDAGLRDLVSTEGNSANFDEWFKKRNEAIDRSGVPANVKDYMKGNEDFGEGENLPNPESPAVREAKDIEERSRAGRRKDAQGRPAPTITGAPPQPGRDLPLEMGLDPLNELGPTQHGI